MKSNFSEQELKERALELLYGLLDESEAEELRRLIASDATAARIFDEARATVDRFARAARWEETPEADVDETTAKNVAVETAPFDAGAALLFDAFSAAVDAETSEAGETNALETDGESSGSNRKRAKRRLNLLRKTKSASKNERAEKDGDGGKRRESRKERRREKKGKSEKLVNLAKSARPATASRFRFGSKGRVDGESGWATVGRTSRGDGGERRSAARRFLARVPKPTLFQNLIIALAVVALSTAVGFWAQESALQARFRDDFRIQIAAPRTLARGESQTIAATTTAPNGKPRRVPIRFSFSDAETGAPLLAHTESGDASGVARFKIPDVSDFPARTRLTISAGEREKETFETILTVVDAPKANVGANASARFAASEAVEENVAETDVSPKSRTQVKKSTARRETLNRQVVPSGAEKERAQEAGMYFMRVETARPAALGRSAAHKMGMGTATNAAPSPGGGTMDAMGGMGMTSSASPSPGGGMGATVVTTDATPRFSFALSGEKDESAAPTTMGTMGTDASNDAGAETPIADADADEAPSDDFDRAVAELESAVSNDGDEALELAGVGEDLPAFAATLDASEKRGLDVRFYPVGGRLVAGRENVVWFECVDADGRPVVGEFALNDSAGRVATAKTSDGGVGSLRWTPDVDETYSLETAFNGKIAKIVETGKDDENGKNVETAQAEAASEDFVASPTFETFRFSAPTATVERVAFSVPTRVLESENGVELEIWSENGIPLAATVEKNGVALAQRVWTAKKGRRRVVVPLDANVSGALNVSLWNCARTPFEKVGSAAVYRKPTGAPTLSATLERNDAGERALRIAVGSKDGLENAEAVRLEAFWAPTLDAALGALELDETLLYASDERRAETLATLALPTATEPILFDNLLEMKESALKKLNAFWLGEAGLAGRVVGLGFLSCAALAALTIFCVLFGALKARRGAVVVLFCAALATLFYFERRRIDFSETLSQAIAVSVDESKAAQRNATGATNVSNGDAEETAAVDAKSLPIVLIWTDAASKSADGAEWSVPLDGRLATTEAGFVLTKMVADDGARAWLAVPLAEEKDGEETDESR